MQRNKKIKIRTSEMQYFMLSERANEYSISISEYIRQTLFQKQDKLPKYRYEGIIKEIISELNLSTRRLNRMDIKNKEKYYDRIREMVSQVIKFSEMNWYGCSNS